MSTTSLPVIDMAPLFGANAAERSAVAAAIGEACRDSGFFYVTGHGIDAAADVDIVTETGRVGRVRNGDGPVSNLRNVSRVGPATRVHIAEELTSGKPDQKEGLYFGSELGPDEPRVRRRLPLHGANLFPARPSALRDLVLDYIAAATRSAHALMEGIGLSLSLEADYFYRHYTNDPTILFRIFHYPPVAASSPDWGVGEHTDYGLLTLLAQDANGGLQVKTRRGWIEAPPVPGTLVCNIGDMLDRLTGGLYRSTPHRAKNVSGRGRLSFPFFFDPGFDAVVRPLPERASQIVDDRDMRWDRQSVHGFSGTYGDYLLNKVSHVFPELRREAIP